MQPKDNPDSDVLNLKEASRFIRVSEKTMREMARNQKVPCRKVGREWRFLRHGLELWLAGQQPEPVAAEASAAYGQPLLPSMDLPSDEEKQGRPGFGDTAFTKNRREPLHRWVPWVAGFSAAFVEGVLDAVLDKDSRDVLVLDPFAGVGTTLVETVKRGDSAVGFEINPYAALACAVKLESLRCRTGALTKGIRGLDGLRRLRDKKKSPPKSKSPAGFRSRRPFFSPAVERQVLLLQDYIAGQKDRFTRKAMELALGAVMVSFSNYSYEPSLSTRAAAGKAEIEDADVIAVFRTKLNEIEADIAFLQNHMKRFEDMPGAQVHLESYLNGADALGDNSVDAIVTSPPYLNNYHYVRNTRPQLYWLGLADGNGALKQLEEDNFGQFWQTVRNAAPVDLTFQLPELQSLLGELRSSNTDRGVYGGAGWANYAATYFNDCNRFFEVTRRVMKPCGRVVIVIGNNIVQGLHIETDRFLAEIGGMHGFQLEEMHRVRKKRTGSSIVNSSVRTATTRKRTELYETAVELIAPE